MSRYETDAPALPANYTKQAKAVAEKQGALAGYRLADEIQKYLTVAGTVPLLPTVAVTAVVPASSPKKISAIEATNYYDQAVVVTAKVAQVSVHRNMAFINLDQAFPNSPLAAVVFEENLPQFGDVQKLSGQQVEITGTVTEYRGKPEIVLESTNQVKVVTGN